MTDPLRIAMVAPPFYEVPPKGYGGIEAVVAQLADGLVDRGHDVTLVAAGGSTTKARLVTTFDEPQWERLGRAEPELLHAARVSEILAELRPSWPTTQITSTSGCRSPASPSRVWPSTSSSCRAGTRSENRRRRTVVGSPRENRVAASPSGVRQA